MRYINTTNDNITFTDVDGRVVIVPKNRVYTHFKNDTITFLLVERYDKEGICLFTTLAEDLQINGVTYTYEQLLNGEGTGDMFSPTGLIIKLVDELPASGEQSTIYLIANDKGSFTEYLWLEETSKWEELGDVSKIDLSNYFTKSEINAMFANYYTQSEIDDMFDGYYTKDELYSKTESDTKYATQTVVNEEIAARIQGDSAINTALQSKADKSDTYTKTQVDTAMASKANTADLATVATSGSYNDLSDKPTIPTVPTNVSAFTNDAGYLTQHQSLADYYTKTETDNAIATAMEDIDLSDYVDVTTFNKKELATAKALTQLNDTKADKTELPDVSTLATKSEVEALEPYAIDLDAYVANGITEAQYDEIVQAVSDGRVIKATYETRDYIVESVYVDGDVMKISLSDELKHRFFQFGRSTGTVSPTTAEYVSLVEKGVWNAKANASSVYTKSEIDAMIGNINTILASI